MTEQKVIEEVLEFIWTQREIGNDSIDALLNINEIKEAKADRETLKVLEHAGMAHIKGNRITLTSKGEKMAEATVRRHRLAERLLTEVLEIEEKNIEENACSFEHSLSPLVTDSICTLLGHPPTCPHGLPIPRGECCKKYKVEVSPLVQPLKDMEIGHKGRIVFIMPRSHSRLDRLASLGIVPGSIIKLHQKQPSFVIEIGETTLAIDYDITKEIYVRREK